MAGHKNLQMTTYPHPDHDKVYKEAIEDIELGFDPARVIQWLRRQYRVIGTWVYDGELTRVTDKCTRKAGRPRKQ